MNEAGIDISGHEPKSIAQSVKESFGYVIAIFDTAKERSPVFPFTLEYRRPQYRRWIARAENRGIRRVREEFKDKARQFIADTAEIKPSELSIA